MERYVLTGGASCGKSAIMLSLEYEWKLPVIREAAEDIIKLYQAKGIEEPWLRTGFQDEVLELQLQREEQAEKAGYERVFLDRGIIDGLAYYQIVSQQPSEMLKSAIKKSKARPYEKVFLIESLGEVENTRVRREDKEEALKLQKLQEQNYKEYGYNPIRVPPKKLDERVKYILDNL